MASTRLRRVVDLYPQLHSTKKRPPGVLVNSASTHPSCLAMSTTSRLNRSCPAMTSSWSTTMVARIGDTGSRDGGAGWRFGARRQRLTVAPPQASQRREPGERQALRQRGIDRRTGRGLTPSRTSALRDGGEGPGDGWPIGRKPLQRKVECARLALARHPLVTCHGDLQGGCSVGRLALPATDHLHGHRGSPSMPGEGAQRPWLDGERGRAKSDAESK